MPLALGQRLLAHQIFGRGILALIAVAVVIMLIRYWPVIRRWWQDRR